MGSEGSKEKGKSSDSNGRRLSDSESKEGASAAANNAIGGSSRNIALPPAIKVGTSISCNENLLNAGLPQQTDKLSIDASRSRSGSASSNKKRPTMALKNRQLIQGCFQNPHENLGRRILKRTAEKRKDFGRFYVGLNSEQKDDLEETIKTLLKKSVANVEFMDEVQRLAEEFGERFVQYRMLSFKADYFSSIADATITECVYLDNAVHPAHLTLSAFSQFITTLFSSVRDGFYNEMRRIRRASNSFSTGSNGSARREKKASLDSTSREASPRSGSPGADESSSHNSAASSEDSFHLRPPAKDNSPTPVADSNKENEEVPTSQENKTVEDILAPISQHKNLSTNSLDEREQNSVEQKAEEQRAETLP